MVHKCALAFLLVLLLILPVQADLFADMNEKVMSYNEHASEVPDPIKMLLGNDEIYGIISMNDGSTLLVRGVTKDAFVTEFSKVAEDVKVETINFTAEDALAALRMSVGKMTEDLKYDVDLNGKVSSIDARIILQQAVGLSSETNPTIIIRTDENTVRSIMDDEDPAKVFFAAYDSGALKVEGVGVVKVITLAIGNTFLTIARLIGIVKI